MDAILDLAEQHRRPAAGSVPTFREQYGSDAIHHGICSCCGEPCNGQTITSADANDLANALQSALPAIPPDDVCGHPLIDFSLRSSYALSELIAFLRKGECL